MGISDEQGLGKGMGVGRCSVCLESSPQSCAAEAGAGKVNLGRRAHWTEHGGL